MDNKLNDFLHRQDTSFDEVQFNKTLTKKLTHYFPFCNKKTNGHKNTK